MVIHQDPCVADHSILLNHVGQGSDESLPVFVIPNNSLAVIAPRGDMIDSTWIGYTKRPRHIGIVIG